MKRCPECRRDYFDDTLLYCLEDGVALVQGSVPVTGGARDEPATAILSATGANAGKLLDESRTLPQIQTGASGEGDEGFRVAVVPLKFNGNDAGIKQLAEGLSEDVVKGLTLFSYLAVVSSDGGDIRRAPEARYLIEGSIRQAGPKLRISVQLTDRVTTENLWAESYSVNFEPDRIFEIQDELVPRIVSTVADMHGVLPRTMGERLRARSPNSLTPYEALVRSFSYFDRVTPAEWRSALDGIESGLAKAPGYGTLRAMRALLLVQGYAQGFDVSEEGLRLGSGEARLAIEASSSDHLAWFALAQALFFGKEFGSLKPAVKRSLALNPMDGNAAALFGEMICYSGDWEWGLELAKSARDLNPNFPGWYWHANFNDAYRRRAYDEALEIALRMNLNSNWGAHVLTAVTYGQLGKPEQARVAWEKALMVRPEIPKMVPRDMKVWFDDEHGAHLMEGLRKAGIEIEEAY